MPHRQKAKVKPRRFAIFSDVHGNLPALSAVLADADTQEITDWLCLGDIIGYGPDPSGCVQLLRRRKIPVLLGNHDAEAASPGACSMRDQARRAIEWTRKNLSGAQLSWLRKLPVHFLDETFEAVHSSLLHPLDWNYVTDPMIALLHFFNQSRPVCFCGHTHMPALWEMESRTVDEMICPLDRPFELKGRKKWLINVGSVGQPRDGDVRACYVIYQPAQRRVEFRRVSYDLASVTKAILDSGLPRSLAERLVVGC